MLVRKNLMIDNEIWSGLEVLHEVKRELSLSKLVNEALKRYLEQEERENLAYKIRMIAANNPDKMTIDEERETLEELASLTPDDMEIVKIEKL